MGFLDWRGWSRLDELDRRVGLRREVTEASIRSSQLWLWAITAMMLVMAVSNVIERDWLRAGAFAAFAPVSVATNRRSIKKLRRRGGLL